MILIYAILMVCLLVSVVSKPAYALAALICMFGIEQWTMSFSPFFTAHRTIGNFSMGGLVLLAVIVQFCRGRPLLQNLPLVCWPVVALYVMALASFAWALEPDLVIEHWRKSWPYIFTSVFLASMLFNEPRDLKDGLMGALAFGALLMMLLILTTEVTGRGIHTQYVLSLKARQEGNALAIAQMCGILVLIAVLMNFKGLARFWQLTRWGIVTVGIALILQSKSRGEFFSLAITGVIFVPLSRRFENVKGVLATVVGIVAFGLITILLYDALAKGGRWEVETMEKAYLGGRVVNVEALLSTWKDSSPLHWLLGLGSSASYDIIGIYPHVVPFEILGEEGLIGFALFCLICLLSARSVIRTYPLVRTHPDALGVLAALSGIVFFRFMISCKTLSFLDSSNLFLFAIMLGKYELAVRRTLAQEDFVDLTEAPVVTAA